MKRIITLTLIVIFVTLFNPFVVKAQNSPYPYKDIKSVTYYTTLSTTYQELQSTLPAIKSTGFNTVWLVNVWSEFNPKPLTTPPVYNEQAFTNLKFVLALLKANNMQVILPLNYLGQGWRPEGIDCNWIKNPTMYGAFETYVKEFLTRIVDYHDIVYIMVFTEETEPCSGLSSWQEHASLLRPTLGSLPTRIPLDLRSKFRIGYHDYSLINLAYSFPDSPIQSPISFDFVSMVAYGLEDKTDSDIKSEVNLRASRFKQLYPNTPLIIGEFGGRACGNDDNQSRVIINIVSDAMDKGFGFNLWGWKPGPPNQECTNPVYGGLAITNQDGSLKKAAVEIKTFLTSNTPLTCTCQNNACTSSCSFDTYSDITYASPIKCSLPSSLFTATPSVDNQYNWCQSTKRTKGDTDSGGVVDNIDYLYYVTAVNGGKLPPKVNPDVNGDGEVGVADREIIMKTLQ